MIEYWRELIYPLGFISSIAFGARGLLQWITSEIRQKSVVTRAFWRLSLVGNILLMLHAFFQSQFHVCFVQACNSVISWRNLNLMQPQNRQMAFGKVLKLLALVMAWVLVGFLLQGLLLSNGQVEWFRLPTPSLDGPSPLYVEPIWHLIGFLALILFSSRFWIQWWYAEQQQASVISPMFWWISLIGGILTLIYFVRIEDTVNIIGPAFGLIPYIRNIMLMQRKSDSKVLASSS